jgi:large subunit ribosomal protein L23
MSRNKYVKRAAEQKISLSAACNIINMPLVTEKATHATQYRCFVFKTHADATKPMIKQSVEKLFKVKVDSVNTAITKGKEKRFRGIVGKRSGFKKAYVTLAEGYTIDVGAGV